PPRPRTKVLTPPHAVQPASMPRPDLPAGFASNVNESATHFPADPVGGAAGDFDTAALHVRAEVHPRTADNADAPAGHRAADPFHFGEVAAQFDFVRAVAFDVEMFVEALLALAEHDRE